MIKKVVSIKNVGKFVNYSCSGDVSFRRLTLIYAENGEGKTTLSAILRSLRSGVPGSIQERRTLGQKGTPSVQLRLSGANAAFTGTGWDRTEPALEIFDSTFVSQNVYAGDAVEHEHKKNLHRFAIGETGVTLAERITELDGTIREITSRIFSTKSDIEKHVLQPMDFDTFFNLQHVDDIDVGMAGKEKEIEALKKATAIAEKHPFSTLELPQLPLEPIDNLLSKRLEDVSTDAEKMVQAHISRCMDQRGEGWIEQGLEYMQDDQCPFCGQNLVGINLIAAYRSYFSRTYRNLKDEIGRMSSCLEGMLAQEKILGIRGTVADNESRSEFWKDHVDAPFPQIAFEEIARAWNNVRLLLGEHLKQKADSPLEEIYFSPQLRKAAMAYNEARKSVANYNRLVEETNKRIAEKKAEVASADLASAQSDLLKLLNIKARFSEPTSKLCTVYQNLTQKKKGLEREKSAARKKLRRRTLELLRRYQNRINEYLEKFGTGFRIVETKESHIGGKPSVDYRISINDVAFSPKPSDSSAPVVCFKNTLSSGTR